MEPRPPPRLVSVRLTELLDLGELAVDRGFCCMPQDVGEEDDDDGAQHAMDEAGEFCIACGKVPEVDTPAPGEHRSRANDHQRPQAALEAYRNNAGHIVTDLRRSGRLKQMLDYAPGHAIGQRQGDNDEKEPEAVHGSRQPKRPQQHDADRQ